jgi:diguanylate cyclase (GGDEF)-like protein
MTLKLPQPNELTNINNNRTQFIKVLEDKIAEAKRHNYLLGLLLIDLDNFKSVNNNLGYLIGDLLLTETLARLKSCLGTDDFVMRLAGDEFIIMLGKINHLNDAEAAAQKIMQAFVPLYQLEGNNVHISPSIGIACYPSAGADAQSLLQNADIAMTYAKTLGRSNYQLYAEETNKKYKQKFYLENALKFALEKQELFLYYQPIFDLSNKKMVGMEALLRWQHPEVGLISPNLFIPLAEQNGVITAIGEWALKNICEQGSQWHAAGHNDFTLSINISSYQLLQKSFPQLLLQTLNNTHISPNLLDLELTETAFIAHSSYFENVLKKIHEAGISITIDDFGTGHSSLTRLKRLPIKALKIDKSFVQDIIPNSSDAVIVNSLIALGKNLGLNVIAEGIETPGHLDFLINNSCPQGQGYYLCKPLSAKQMTAFLDKNKQ